MALTKMVNGVSVVCSPQEEAQIRAGWAQADAERLRYQREEAYKDKRKSEYPTLDEQLDMLWHSMDTGEIQKSNAFYDAIKTVKDKYPKTTIQGA